MIEVAGAPLHGDDARTISSIAGRIFNTTVVARLTRGEERESPQAFEVVILVDAGLGALYAA